MRVLSAAVALLTLAGVATSGAAQASQPRAAASTAWKVESPPNQNKTGTGINELSAVSCTSDRACTAVGSHAASLSSPGFSLAERWNGTSWRIQTTALPKGAEASSLAGVSCTAATACTAVGEAFEKSTKRSVNLAEVWNGATWRVQSVPTTRGSTDATLSAVACTSASVCTAVGFSDLTAGRVLAVAERWNGKAWRLQALPKAATTQLQAVACSSTRECFAVGDVTGTGNARPFVEAWNGTTWHVQAIPLPAASGGGILSAVSCTSSRACTATGANFSASGPTLAERWDGTRWRVQSTPAPANSDVSHQEVDLNSVSCSSSSICTASGEYAPAGHSAYFLEAWNGRSWRLVTAPHPSGFEAGAVNAVACGTSRCTAVGAWSGGPIYIAALAMAN